MSVKSSSSQGESSGGPVVRVGYLKKLKTSKKKYFVLRAETCESSARLEYYDSEKKFNSGQAPKRSIPLKTCFNINKRHDTKHKHVIALYTKDDCFCVVLDSEEDLDAWLKALLSQQQGEEVSDGQTPRPTFEHVWQVTLLSRGLGATPLISGYNKTSETSVYRLCLTDKTLSLIRIDCNTAQAELSLSSIRSCGHLKNFFYLEAGRSSGIGAGELWMETEDSNIAQNVHKTVFHTMSSNSSSREELGPKSRNRSSSATESSKPNSMARRQTLTGTPKPIPYQQDHTPNVNETPVPCTSTNNTTAGNVAWPGTVNHQRTRSLPLAHPAPITTDNPIHPPRAAKRSTNQSSKCFADSRARCDSMPSRPRTTSEGNHPIPSWDRITSYLIPLRLARDSHSPPTCSPVSPPSAACSTDSAGSSLSIDESEPWHEPDIHRGRFPTSLTPDEAIAEENCDDCTDSPCMVHLSPTRSSYVQMAPISSDDGYVDMSPRGRHTAMSPAASMSSVTSGTPSTDMRFAEYPLEKVTSYLTPSEDDETSSAERPRTYSMGSRPFKSRIEQARDRAWSVGSKGKKGYNRVLPPHGSQPHTGTKSSSAPLLSNSRLHSSHNSIGQMDDLMELDFSRKNSTGYMDMRPARVPVGYVDMRPGHIERPPDTTPYVDMRPGSSPAKPMYTQSEMNPDCSRPDYMDMDSKRNSNSHMCTLGSSFSSVASTSPISQCNNLDYIDMTKSSQMDMYMSSPVKSALSGFSHGSPSSIDYIDMDYSTTPTTAASTPSHQEHRGYVEMSLGSRANQNTSDYTMMNMSNAKKKERKLKKETTRSQPITIQNAVPPSQTVSGTSPIYTLLSGRKNSTGTPPKMYLPLHTSPYSSLPRQRSRKNSRRDSKDSSSSSINTPSSSSTIFPFSLNSPSSPIYLPAKSPNTEGRGRLDNRSSDYTVMDFERKPPSVSEYVNFNPAVSNSNSLTNSSDYAVMQPGIVDVRTTNPTSLYSQMEALMIAEPTRCFKPISDDTKVDDGTEESQKDQACGETTRVSGSRPGSVSSDTKFSRPGSESSEVGSTTSTVVGSRPASVNSENMRPDGQLHYASLDLAQIADEEANKSPKTVAKSQGGDAPTTVMIPTTFAYAEIDFSRGDSLKSNQLLNNAKIKH